MTPDEGGILAANWSGLARIELVEQDGVAVDTRSSAILSRNIAGNIDTCLNSHSLFVLTGSALHNNVYVFIYTAVYSQTLTAFKQLQ